MKSAALAALFAFLLAACAPREAEHLFAGPTMGTQYHIKVVAPLDADGRASLEQAVKDTLERVNALMSTYRPDSQLSQFNTSTNTTPIPIDPEMVEVFRVSMRVSEESGGAFDVTVGPLVNAFGFGPNAPPTPPAEEELAALRERVGYTMLTLDPAAKTLQKARPDLYCDLSAVAKGYGVDAVARTLDAAGIDRYMVEIGGEVHTRGRNLRGEYWRIGIEKPGSEAQIPQDIIELNNYSMATSGDYRNFYEHKGQRYSHTIDPRTGHPAQHALASATVLHARCADADAYATTLMVLGPDAGYDFAVEHNLAAYLIVHGPGETFTEKRTPAFEAYQNQP
jgi:thiamine biosynthesis lipoprotein